jgi:phosphopantothenoylcysteine decarboxylase/phosphopantothenate--cysteine ligase
MRFQGKNFILGVTGSIACYKSCQLLRKIKAEGGDVKVVMTKNAAEFVTPLTFKTLSANPVYSDMFTPLEKSFSNSGFDYDYELAHIRLTEWADMVIVAPATANIIAKAACGIADDLLSTLLVSFNGTVVMVPAMDEEMYNNPIFKQNLAKLKKVGFNIIPAKKGLLASGKVGEGRFPEIDDVADYINDKLLSQADLSGIKVLVTAGGTREYIDPVRFIGNASSGKMGYALAEAAYKRGAKVKLVSAPTSLPKPQGVEVIDITTASQMKDKVMENFKSCDVLIMASAVGDFRAEKFEKQKRGRAKGEWNIKLVPNSDILLEAGKVKKGKITVGFSIETRKQLEKAKEKLKRKKLDLIVANDINIEDSGFGSDTNKAVLIDKKGKIEKLPLLSKKGLSDKILDKIKEMGVKR